MGEVGECAVVIPHLKFTTKLLLIIFISILLPFLVLTVFLRTEIRENIFLEKQDKLFGLTYQLDHYLKSDFTDILEEESALDLTRDEKILVLNRRLKDITDFVASGNPGVGVGYYSRELDGVVTYGPSDEFQYTVGTSIKEGHHGLIVMKQGRDLVQTGELVRGNIMNCMHPLIRDGEVIGYIWANETVDHVNSQLSSILERVYLFLMIVLSVIYTSVYLVSKSFLQGISQLKYGIEILMGDQKTRLPTIKGELNVIGEKVNELMDNLSFIRSYSNYILDAVACTVLVVSNDGVVTYVNRTFFRMFSHLGGDICGKRSKDVFGKRIGSLIEEGLERDVYYEGMELELFGRILKVSSSLLVDDKDNKLGLVLIVEDLTLIRKYEKQLGEKERLAALGEMGLGVAHEVKNPLTSVKGFTQMLQRPSISDEKRIEYLRIMDDELNRVNRLLNELLIYGGQSPLRLSEFDAGDILSELVREHEIGNRNVEYRIERNEEGAYTISADRYKIIQVFENLFRNAEDALRGREKGIIDIVLAGDDRNVEVKIRDNGSGISSEHKKKIFDPFFTTKDHGTGFGLPICYRLIGEIGGEISVDSEEGRYTEVRVILNKEIGE